jgi:hypothetical protein
MSESKASTQGKLKPNRALTHARNSKTDVAGPIMVFWKPRLLALIPSFGLLQYIIKVNV